MLEKLLNKKIAMHYMVLGQNTKIWAKNSKKVEIKSIEFFLLKLSIKKIPNTKS